MRPSEGRVASSILAGLAKPPLLAAAHLVGSWAYRGEKLPLCLTASSATHWLIGLRRSESDWGLSHKEERDSMSRVFVSAEQRQLTWLWNLRQGDGSQLRSVPAVSSDLFGSSQGWAALPLHQFTVDTLCLPHSLLVRLDLLLANPCGAAIPQLAVKGVMPGKRRRVQIGRASCRERV